MSRKPSPSRNSRIAATTRWRSSSASLHLLAAQVEVAVAQPRVLADLAGEALDLEGRRLGVGEQLGRGRPASSNSPVGSSGLTVSSERRTTVAGWR